MTIYWNYDFALHTLSSKTNFSPKFCFSLETLENRSTNPLVHSYKVPTKMWCEAYTIWAMMYDKRYARQAWRTLWIILDVFTRMRYNMFATPYRPEDCTFYLSIRFHIQESNAWVIELVRIATIKPEFMRLNQIYRVFFNCALVSAQTVKAWHLWTKHTPARLISSLLSISHRVKPREGILDVIGHNKKKNKKIAS